MSEWLKHLTVDIGASETNLRGSRRQPSSEIITSPSWNAANLGRSPTLPPQGTGARREY